MRSTPLWVCRAAVLVALGLIACDERRPPAKYNLRPIGAPALRPVDGPAIRGGNKRWVKVSEVHRPHRHIVRFPSLKEMKRTPKFVALAEVLKSAVADRYRAWKGRTRPRSPFRITVTEYSIRRMPYLVGVDFVAFCGGRDLSPLSYVEHHLLVAGKKKLDVLASHRPPCGSVGDRQVAFRDLIGDGPVELVETYVERSHLVPDFQEVSVFAREPTGLRRVAYLRESSVISSFHVSFVRPGPAGNRKIVTRFLMPEKVRAIVRQRPCWRYRFFEVSNTYSYARAAGNYQPVDRSRRLLRRREALDLSRGDLPQGSCGG